MARYYSIQDATWHEGEIHATVYDITNSWFNKVQQEILHETFWGPVVDAVGEAYDKTEDIVLDLINA